MCMEDIKLGRALDSGPKQVAIPAATATVLLAADGKRTRLTIASNGARVLMVAPAGMTLSATAGFPIPVEAPILTMRIEEWGPMITWDWSAFDAGAGMVVTVAAQTLQREV